MKSLRDMSPYELGESNLGDAVPYLIGYLESNSKVDVRLAASAIGKLADDYSEGCNKAIPSLLLALRSDGPQVRQYVLKSMLKLDIPRTRQVTQILEEICKQDEKEYNRKLAKKLLSKFLGTDTQSSAKNSNGGNSDALTEEIIPRRKKFELTGEQKRILLLPVENPIQIKGVAGSGKTTIAIGRARHLVRSAAPDLFRDTHICIFSYTKNLIKYVESLLDGEGIGSRELSVVNFHKWAYGFLKEQGFWRTHEVADDKFINAVIRTQLASLRSAHADRAILNKQLVFYREEVAWMKGRRILKKQDYLDARRTGRGTSDRVLASDKELLWLVFKDYCEKAMEANLVDFDDFALVALEYVENKPEFIPPYSHIVIDEAQDLTVAQLSCIAQLVDPEVNSISIIADAAQQIYKSGFSWSEVGINVRGGRTVELKHNYRNTRQIAEAAISLLNHDPQKGDFSEHIVPVREGKMPQVIRIPIAREINFLVGQLNAVDLRSESLVILHPERSGVQHFLEKLKQEGFCPIELSSAKAGQINMTGLYICTMKSIKGLEFNHVVMAGLDDVLLPHRHGFADNDDELHVSTERRILYTCMTRARDTLQLTFTQKPSRFLSEIEIDLVDEIRWS